MGNEDIVKEYNSTVTVGSWKLGVKSIHTHWEGHDSGKMEDMPGDFLETRVLVKSISKEASPLSPEESLAVKYRVVLSKIRKEITHEPKEYAKLWHYHIRNQVKEQPTLYLQNLKKAVKEAIKPPPQIHLPLTLFKPFNSIS